MTARMSERVSLGEKPIHLVSREVGQLKRKKEKVVGAAKSHFKSALATGGIVDLALPEGGQCLPHDAAQGKAGLRQQDAWRDGDFVGGDGHSRMMALLGACSSSGFRRQRWG